MLWNVETIEKPGAGLNFQPRQSKINNSKTDVVTVCCKICNIYVFELRSVTTTKLLVIVEI